MLDQLSTKTDKKDLDGGSLFIPVCFCVPNFSSMMMKAFIKAAPHSRGPLDLGKNLLKNYYRKRLGHLQKDWQITTTKSWFYSKQIQICGAV